MNEKKVSVIVPVYNTEKYLDCCINSVLNQTYDNFESLLIDDGSNDNSSNICDNYALKDNRIKVIHQENQGVSGARNRGIKESNGEYIAFIDSDDWWHKDFLLYIVNELEKFDFSICEVIRYIDGIENPYPKYNCDTNKWCWPIINSYNVSMYYGVFNKKILINNNIQFTNNRKTGEDQEFTYKYMLHCKNIGIVPQAKYYYRIYNNSVMFTANYNHFQAVDAMLSVEEYAKSVCDSDQYKLISNALRNHKCPFILEFAILTVLTLGDKPNKVLKYLKENNYFDLLSDACKSENHWDSVFIKMWSFNPMFCLNYFYIKKAIGRFGRKILNK